MSVVRVNRLIAIDEIDEEIYYPCWLGGYNYSLSKEEILEIINGLENFVEIYGDCIDEINENKKIRYQKEMEEYFKTSKQDKIISKRTNGYVYIFKCADKYKIGMSKNVEHRIKQLDNRPFPCELIYKSDATKYYYEVEQEIHLKYSKYKIDGEWYELSEETLLSIIDDTADLVNYYNDGFFKPDRLRRIRGEYSGT